MATPSKAELLMLLKNLESHEQETRFLRFFEDRNLYPKHHEFMASGLQFRQRNFIAANRIGKSTVAECELTMHLTGIYPDWWTGKKFTRAQDWWVVCVDSDTIKATVQPALLGKIGEFGTGFIPKSKLDFSTLKMPRRATPWLVRSESSTKAVSLVRLNSSPLNQDELLFRAQNEASGLTKNAQKTSM